MPGAVVKVEGARQLRATLKRAGDDLTDLKTVHAKVGRIVLPGAQRRVPRRSGRLGASLRTGATKTTAILRAGNNSSVPYANVIEWGWGRRHIAAQPFAVPAARESEPAWLSLYDAEVQRIVNRVKGAPTG